MKRILLLLLLIAAAASASCQKLEKDTYLSIDKYMIEFKSEGEIRTLELKTNGTPSVVTPSWVSHQIENSGDEQWTLVLKCTENTTSDVRNGILRVDSGNARKSVSLRQNQKIMTTPDNNTSDPENNTDGTGHITPQVISDLLALNGKKCLYSIAETDENIKMTYLENWPSNKVPADDDFKKIEIPRNLLNSFKDNKFSVQFYFSSGESSTINVVDAPAEITVDKESISTKMYDLVNGGYTKDTINFVVRCPRPELAKVQCIADDDENSYACQSCTIKTSISDNSLRGMAIITTDTRILRWPYTFWTVKVSDYSNSNVKKIDIPYQCEYNSFGITKEELRKALTALYNECNGKNWINQKNWLSDKDITEWEGVWYSAGIGSGEHCPEYCVKINDFYVPIATFSIELPNNNIKGIIPDEFWEICKWCDGIDLACNDLTGNKVHPNVWNERMFSVHLIDTNIELSLDDAINAPNLGHLLVHETKCKAPTEKFFNAKFPRLIRLTATFASPSPLPDNVINFKENAPILVQMYLWNVSSYPENITDLTQLYALYINGRKLIYRMDEYDGSVFG